MSHDGHTRRDYDDALSDLRAVLAEMGGLAERQLRDGLQALVTRDAELGDGVRAGDRRINELDLRVDQQATAILARRQPAGPDLRFLMAAIRSGTDLERIGDEAGKLGRSAVELAGTQGVADDLLHRLERFGEDVRAFLRAALDAFARGDSGTARTIHGRGGRLADVHDGLTGEFVTCMMADPGATRRILHALWCARALERIADHSRNLCESVIYIVEGRDLRHAPARGAPEHL